MAEAMGGILYWVLVAPGIETDALKLFTRILKRTGRPARATRVFVLPLPDYRRHGSLLPGFGLHYRPVMGGFLAQTYDRVPLEDIEFKVVSKRPPTEQEIADLRFAWRVVKHVRSNAVVFARQGAVVACGAGQMSRVDSVIAATHIARRSLERNRAEGRDQDSPATEAQPAAGGVMATDGFFPFPDAVIESARAGATAIAHPGGSREDEAAVQAADEHGLAMVVTGVRHFRH
jgi:phosphoribosylaminoimidazolecarboxamide formyltransferase/IMP cyclohydrolase